MCFTGKAGRKESRDYPNQKEAGLFPNTQGPWLSWEALASYSIRRQQNAGPKRKYIVLSGRGKNIDTMARGIVTSAECDM